MGRTPKVWPRKGRGFWTTIRGEQIPLGHDLKLAKRELARLLADRAPPTLGRYTSPKLIDIYLEACAKRVEKDELSAQTLEAYRYKLESFARYARRIRPEDLRPLHADEWLEQQRWNPTTAALAIRVLKAWSRWCARKGFLDVDRLGLADSPQPLTRDAANPADLLKMEAAIKCPHFLDFYRCLYDIGCRPGELGTLEADRVGWDTATAIVRGKTGPRMVGLTSRVLEILRRAALVNPTGPALRSPLGCQWRKYLIGYHWGRWRAVAGVPDTVVAYSLRHDLWRRWHEAGVSDVVISKQLGHTLKGVPHLHLLVSTYAHADAQHLARAAQDSAAHASNCRSGRAPKANRR